MSNEYMKEMEMWMKNHTWYDEYEMGAIDLLLEEMGDELPDAILIIDKIRKNLDD